MDFNSIYEDALNFGNNLRDCYKNGDKNKDGYLSKQELKAALQDFTGEMITKCEMDELLDDMDPNGDGKITYEGNQTQITQVTQDSQTSQIFALYIS